MPKTGAVACQRPDLSKRAKFKHEPLDYKKQSIRLIKISPELSEDGLIQCRVSHTTINRAQYVCLSYRWGPPEPSQPLLLNGQLFQVRQNLHDFLDAVRSICWWSFWIDAMCIDQGTTVERNHQVSQMGETFKHATRVTIWLGNMPPLLPIIKTLEKVENSIDSITFEDWSVVRADNLLTTHLFNNQYWCRAWVTQEIILAAETVLLLNGQFWSMQRLLDSLRHFYLLEGNRDFPDSAMARFADGIVVAGMGMFSLLERFRQQECEDTRDRIFSILSLCVSQDTVRVDYGISNEALAYETLRHATTRPLCICTALLIAQTLALGVKPENGQQKDANICPFIEVDLTDQLFYIEGGSVSKFDSSRRKIRRMYYKLCMYDSEQWSIRWPNSPMSTFWPRDEVCHVLHHFLNYIVSREAVDEFFNAPNAELETRSEPKTTIPPLLEHMAHDKDALALINSYGEAVKIRASGERQCTVRIALPFLAKAIRHQVRAEHAGEKRRENMFDQPFVWPEIRKEGGLDVERITTWLTWDEGGPVSPWRLGRNLGDVAANVNETTKSDGVERHV